MKCLKIFIKSGEKDHSEDTGVVRNNIKIDL
jgi:hypothetical protein